MDQKQIGLKFIIVGISSLYLLFIVKEKLDFLNESFSFSVKSPVTAKFEITPPTTASPSYYYNRESAYLINFAIDQTNGGLYMATDASGAIADLSGIGIWNFTAPPGTMSSLKTPSAQAMGILYFIREYHRLQDNGIAGLNSLINNPANQISVPLDLLTVYAKNLADFSIVGDPFKISAADQAALGVDANKAFYYGFTQADGSGGMVDGSNGSSSPESLLPWALVELALIMQEVGVAVSVYQPYIDEAIEWWNWRKTSGVHVPYGYGNNSFFGAGKDVYYGPLGLTLFELTNTAEYKSGPGTMNDGLPLGALPYMYNALGNPGNNPDLGNPPAYAIQDGAYVSGYARSICFAKAEQRTGVGLPNYNDRQPFQEFGFSPLYEKGNSFPNYDINSSAELLAEGIDPIPAFTHFSGREVFAGTQRTLWFNYSFEINGGLFYSGPYGNPNYPADFTTAKQEEMIFDYWNYCINTFWDDATGVAAWVENTSTPNYKPCFSGGVDVPIADWKAPVFGGQSNVWSEGNDAVISITDVVDENWDFLSFKFDDIGVNMVEVVYTNDNGLTWQTTTATNTTGDNYSDTIPAATVASAHNANYDFYYFVRAKDDFENYRTDIPNVQEVSETGIVDINGIDNPIDISIAHRIANPNPILYDYGDLPDIANGSTGINDYETYDSTGGPKHEIIDGLFLGDSVDVDNDGVPSALAIGDDSGDGYDDEDGLIFLPSIDIKPNSTIRLPLSVTNTTGLMAHLEGWIDWNANGNLEDTGEKIIDINDNGDGVFPLYIEITIPMDAQINSLLGFRIRLSQTNNMTPYGVVNSGEVEDYLIEVKCPTNNCLPVTTEVL